MWKLTTEQKSEVVRRHIDGESPKVIAADFSVTYAAVYSILRTRGLNRSNSEAQSVVAYDRKAFAANSPDANYWTGFLMADGAIVHRGTAAPTVALVLSDVDLTHIEKFRAFLHSGHKIVRVAPRMSGGYMNAGGWRLAIRSKDLASDLALRGVVPNKTRIASAGDLADNRDFWRGVIDGDGSFGVYRSGALLRLVGSETIVTQFLDFARRHVPTSATVRPHRSIFGCAICGPMAVKMLAVLYDGAATALDRKSNAAIEIRRRGNTSLLRAEGSGSGPVEARTKAVREHGLNLALTG